jgi:predicted nucleic acid-binding protein
VKRTVLDTSVLIHHWHRSATSPLERSTPVDSREWARELIRLEESATIVTPVLIEMLCGARSAHELRLTKAYLDEFRVIDDGKVTTADWDEAIRLARRIPPDGRPRQLGDCLIRAIAKRLKFKVRTFDTGMSR